MAKRILGLEIGNSNIKLLESRRKGHQRFVEKSSIIPTPADTIVDGIIKDPERVYQVIEKEIKDHKYRSKELAMVIKSSEIITREILMDKMPPKDMKAILELQYLEYLLVDISEYETTYKILGEVTIDGEVKQEVLIVAAPNTLINPLIDLGDKLKMKIKSININADAVASLFKEDSFMMDMQEESALVLDIGGASTTATIISDGVGVLTKDIDFGLKSLDVMISTQFASNQIKDMEWFKEKHGGIYEEDGKEDIYGQFMSTILKHMLKQKLIPEIRRLMKFHLSRGKHNPLEKIYMIGGGARLKNIDAYMGELLQIPCVADIHVDETQVDLTGEIESRCFANILGIISQF